MDLSKFDRFWPYGPAAGQLYNFPASHIGGTDVLTKYQNSDYEPVTTGSSVIGMAYKDGVIIAADTLVSYGSLARFRDCERVIKINNKTVMGCGGDYADFQFIRSEIEKQTIKDSELKDNHNLKPSALYNWMTTLLYSRRCEQKPLFVDLIIGGINDVLEPDEKPFLGHVSIRGKAYRDDVIATGFGAHLALPILRDFLQQKDNDINNITKVEAQDIVTKCMEVLYYRDCRALSRYTEGLVGRDGSTVLVDVGVRNVDENWKVANLVHGY